MSSSNGNDGALLEDGDTGVVRAFDAELVVSDAVAANVVDVGNRFRISFLHSALLYAKLCEIPVPACVSLSILYAKLCEIRQ